MSRTRFHLLFLALAGLMLVALASTVPAIAQTDDAADAQSTEAPAASPSVQRGEYIANDVAMCVQCHSARDRRGNLLEDRLFLGAPLPVKSPFEGAPRWAFTAPNLRNVPGYTEEEFITFLTTGIRPNGQEARAPMPPYRMDATDAKAVYDYLMSL